MRRVKFLMLMYLGVIGLIVCAAMIGLAIAPPVERDPDAYYEAYWNTIETFDSAKAYDTVSNKMVDQCVEGLYEYDGFDPTYPIVPALAADMPQVSEDGRIYTIRLRPNVRYPAEWADGTPVEPWRDTPRHVKARDFVFAFKRIADFHNASKHFGAIMEGRIVGAKEYFHATENVEPQTWYYDDLDIPGVRAIDDLTLQIELTKPFPQLIYKLIHSAVAPMPKEYYKHYAVTLPTRYRKVEDAERTGDIFHNRRVMRWQMLGTGPYRLVDYERERHVTFEINPLYRGRTDIDGHPSGQGGRHPSLTPQQAYPRSVKRQVYRFSREALPRWYNFKLGSFDRLERIPNDMFNEAIEAGMLSDDLREQGMKQSTLVRPIIEYVGFHLRDPVLGDNPPLRKAMSLAINRKQFIDIHYNGDMQAPAGLVVPGSFTWDSDYRAPYYRYDQEEARRWAIEATRLHRERTGEELPTITYVMRGTSTTTRQRGEFLRLAWQRVGLDVNVEFYDFAKWLEGVRNHKFQTFSSGWVYDYPDEETALQLFYGPHYNAGSNSSGYNDSEYNAMYERAKVMPDGPKRNELYRTMARQIEEEVVACVLYYRKQRELYYDWLGEVSQHPYLKAQPMYYELDGKLREARLSGAVSGTLDELVDQGLWDTGE